MPQSLFVDRSQHRHRAKCIRQSFNRGYSRDEGPHQDTIAFQAQHVRAVDDGTRKHGAVGKAICTQSVW